MHYDDCTTECKFLVQQLAMYMGSGTHIDAPAHCFPTGQTIDKIPLDQLWNPCVVIDVSKQAHELYSVSVEDIQQFERTHGAIQKDFFVIIYTGWDKFWTEPEKYRNELRFPSVSKEAAEYLLSKEISGIGIDTLSPDRPDNGYPVHQLLLGAGKYIVENVANAKQMAVAGGMLFIVPMKISRGPEAPVRLIGMVDAP
jgi:kynurenine formamidase